MEQVTRPPVRAMLKEAMEANAGRSTNVAVRDWVLNRYPGTNPTTIQAQTVAMTVNHPSRVHYPENRKPRLATDPKYDFLYRPGRGELELYDSPRHGRWAIVQDEDGSLRVAADDDAIEPSTDVVLGEGEQIREFAQEAHLRDYLADNLDLLEPGLTLFADEHGRTGVEYSTPMGRIDILAVDRNGDLVIAELKVSRGPDEVAGQILRYKAWVRQHLAMGATSAG